ncbi:MAG TPA: ferritin-like domain-containing protein [Ginsengibacter sp.]
MKTSQTWIEHFSTNIKIQRIDWQIQPSLKNSEKRNILSALKAWQLGETSDGSHLLKASKKYAEKIDDRLYVTAVELFIKEEQKHGNNLGKYLDAIGEDKLTKNWADTLFRKFRYFNSSMELWTLTVLTVESAAQVFYQSLKDATQCKLLKQICRDILLDEAFHIDFQMQRFITITENKNEFSKILRYWVYRIFYFSTITIIWVAYKKCFMAGGNSFISYWRKMSLKFEKTIGKFRRYHYQKISSVSILYKE